MATEVIKAIKSDGTKDYTSLANWIADRKGNIVSRDTIEIAEVYGGGSVGNCIILQADWTVDSTHYIIVRAATGHAHTGVFDTSKAYVQTASGPAFNTTVQGTRLKGLCIETTDGNGGETSLSAACDDGIADSCLVRNDDGYSVRCFPRSANHPWIFRNCVFYRTGGTQDNVDIGGNAFGNAASICAYFYNCDVIQLGGGVDNLSPRASSPPSPVIVTQNCYLHSATAGKNYAGNDPTNSITKGSKDATSDTEATDSNLRSIGFNTTNFNNVTYSTLDLHIKTAATALIKAGVNLASAGVTQDFESDPRAGAFDIGADEIPSTSNVAFTLGGY